MDTETDLQTFYSPPGGVGPWRSVQEMLRHRHEEIAADVAAAIAERKRLGVPLDDASHDWREVARAKTDDAFRATDRAEARTALRAAWLVALGGLSEVGPYVPDPNLDGLEVKLRALPRETYARAAAEVMAHRYGGDDAGGPDSLRAAAAQQAPIRDLVVSAVAGVRGAQLEHGTAPPWEGDALPDFIVAALDAAGFMPSLYAVADRFQELGPLQRRGYGLPRPSTSPSSTAAPVQPHSASRAGAKDQGPAGRTSSASGSRPADAPSATCAVTPGSSPRCGTTDRVEGSPGSGAAA